MKKELDEALCKKYPTMFKDRHGDMRETAMCWGFDCDDGWYELIDKLCEKLVFLDPNVYATQVKEKYGTLRFYFNSNAEKIIWEIMHDCERVAEHNSAYTCEICGKYGETRGVGWLKTLCKEHAKELNYLDNNENEI